MASIQAPSTFIPSKLCSQDEEQLEVVALSSDDIMPEPMTEIVATVSTGNENVMCPLKLILFYLFYK